jgi:hypothetical protein
MVQIKAHTIKSQWINFSLYFVNFMYKTSRNTQFSRVCDWIIPQKERLKGGESNKPIGANQNDIYFLGNGNHYQTDFIEIDKEDLLNIFFNESYTYPNNNLTYLQYGMRIDKSRLKGTTYKRRDTAFNTNQETSDNDPTQYYFLKGVFSNDIIQYLINSKVI